MSRCLSLSFESNAVESSSKELYSVDSVTVSFCQFNFDLQLFAALSLTHTMWHNLSDIRETKECTEHTSSISPKAHQWEDGIWLPTEKAGKGNGGRMIIMK